MKFLNLKLLIIFFFYLSFTHPVFAQSFTNPLSYEVTPAIPKEPSPSGAVFFTKEFDLNYKEGPVALSSSSDGTGNVLVDDGITIKVTRADGSEESFQEIYHVNCAFIEEKPPSDIKHLFKKGVNHVKVMLYDICGTNKLSTPLYLVTETTGPPSSSGPTPFLDLPWDYGKNGMTFNESATSINSYLDHEYPLLSTSLSESTETNADLINYSGAEGSFAYSSHDGYDYGYKAKTKLDTPVLAAADGEASYMNSCGACGNAILIDHKNGYQTRYYHLQHEGLVTHNPSQKVTVMKGQQIGKVGYTGNISPRGEAGSHLHFMVIQDKNNDGDFEDNIPDGITDPFGWQSESSDPWETYSFDYKGKQRTGNKSYYLFKDKLDNLDANLTSNQASFEVGKTKLSFPEGFTSENLKLIANSLPNFTSNILNSLGSTINIEAKNSAGQLVTTFLKNFSLVINFSQFDLSRYNLNTLSIYSSPDQKTWTKENTQIDLNQKTATTHINHLTYFALMAERIDTIAPTTIPVLTGDKGTGNNFRSNITMNLNAVDNQGGLGIEFTTYRIGTGIWQTYTTPLTFTNEGSYKIEFYSQDKDGNLEDLKSTEFTIDKTIPEAKIEIDKTIWDLKVSSIASDSAQLTKTTAPNFKSVYTIKDPAGNTLVLDTYDLNTQNIDLIKIYSLQYNSNPKTLLTDNTFEINYIFSSSKKDPQIQTIYQNFIIKDILTYTLTADATKNKNATPPGKTNITLVEGKKTKKEEKPGLILLKLQTNKGKLEYIY